MANRSGAPVYGNNSEINDFFNDYLREHDDYSNSFHINLNETGDDYQRDAETDFHRYFGLLSPFDFYEPDKKDAIISTLTNYKSGEKNQNPSTFSIVLDDEPNDATTPLKRAVEANGFEKQPRPEVFPLVLVHSLQNGFPSLDDIRPLYIILYDYNVNFLRNIECYKVENRGMLFVSVSDFILFRFGNL
jgi:hypothetical protein